MAKGREEGFNERAALMAMKMLGKGALPITDIAQYSEFSLSEVERLRDDGAAKGRHQ